MLEKGVLPEDIPLSPKEIYWDRWVSWSDWLGSGWRPFEEAREFARSLGLKTSKEWRYFAKGELVKMGVLPEDIPAFPYRVYKNKGWVGMGDWLGTGSRRESRPFEEARKFARSLGLIKVTEWRKYCKGKLPEKGTRPEGIPVRPETTYKNKGWVSWADWLGSPGWRPFEEAREFARSLKLAGGPDWKEYARGQMPDKGTMPKDIPSTPDVVYRSKGWVSWPDWLGSGWRPFEEAREFARSLKLARWADWKKYARGQMQEKEPLPKDIPKTPDSVYKDKGWVSWGDWLGKDRKGETEDK
jgi:hypothetical protein